MKFENEFVVRRPLAACASVLESDTTITSLFPDTQIVSNAGGVRETRTRVSALGAETTVVGGTTVLLGTIDGRLNDVFISKTVAGDAPDPLRR